MQYKPLSATVLPRLRASNFCLQENLTNVMNIILTKLLIFAVIILATLPKRTAHLGEFSIFIGFVNLQAQQ